MKYENEMPRDHYHHSEEIDTGDFKYTFRNKYGIYISAHVDDVNGDVLTMPSGRVISYDDIEDYLGDEYDAYLDASCAEADRLRALQSEMEDAELRDAEQETEYMVRNGYMSFTAPMR